MRHLRQNGIKINWDFCGFHFSPHNIIISKNRIYITEHCFWSEKNLTNVLIRYKAVQWFEVIIFKSTFKTSSLYRPCLVHEGRGAFLVEIGKNLPSTVYHQKCYICIVLLDLVRKIGVPKRFKTIVKAFQKYFFLKNFIQRNTFKYLFVILKLGH